MRWLKKQAEGEPGPGTAGEPMVVPGQLNVTFDRAIAQSKLNALLDQAREIGGVDPLIESLNAKSALFKAAFPSTSSADRELSSETLDAVLSSVFPIRRKRHSIDAIMGRAGLIEGIADLVYGSGALQERLRTFVALVPDDLKKEKRAMRDLAAEILHFRDPEGMPLMSRWVWDEATASGALREFIRGNDGLPEIPIDNQPETYEGARVWFADVLAEGGFYRDVPMLIDLMLAQAYSDYVRAMSSGLGMVQAEFGRSQHPLELQIKLLGIDPVTARGMGGTGEATLH